MTDPIQPDPGHSEDSELTERVEYRLERRYEVAATPEQVWDAIATAEGIATWMVPTRLEPRVGGEVSFDVGAFESTGVVTDYTPTRRFAYEEPWPPVGGHDWSQVTPLATEFLVESTSGGSCVIRVVSSAFGTGADWEREYFDEMVDGWAEMLDRLVARFAVPAH
ncbi:SRPBCC family protein [Agromyces larvae]|uniref:SRPBCC domain-containing protein n=1 Tax=Agromyces larvae TaxID=2929802 RepID=A0ABY4C6W7_9MICO|nr:SRPBCC domain-containing protein [Agromyces larvae]UOE45836.1 SRPBCC domain-containing protein [Agromyces larvae]